MQKCHLSSLPDLLWWCALLDCNKNVRMSASVVVNSLRPRDAYMRQWTNQHWFRQWLVAWPAPSHYLNQCWNILNWIHRNKFHWKLNRNLYIFIQENAFENVVWKMSAILSRPQCVNSVHAKSFLGSIEIYLYIISFLDSRHRWHRYLIHWGWDKMAAISQTTFSNAFSWMKMFEFWLSFHWILLPRVQLTISQHWFR